MSRYLLFSVWLMGVRDFLKLITDEDLDIRSA